MRLWSVVVNQLVHPRGSGCTRLAVICGTGASWAVAISALPLVAFDLSGARLRVELFACPLRLFVRFAEQLLLVREPFFELRRGHRADRRDHARVAAAAKDRALAAVQAGLG